MYMRHRDKKIYFNILRVKITLLCQIKDVLIKRPWSNSKSYLYIILVTKAKQQNLRASGIPKCNVADL